MQSQLLRGLPSVSELLNSPPLKNLVTRVSHTAVVSGVRSFLDDMRQEIRSATGDFKIPDIAELAERVARNVVRREGPRLRPVINATGVILHTGLGRAPLAEEAVEDLLTVARNYSNLEIDLDSGERSRRVSCVEGLLTELTGAEAALVVNNNAGATLLALTALATNREVVVSRGQLVEIGGSYRLPEIMQASGARLREVGTTNRTRLDDYRQAVRADTAALMRVHTSNYRVVGFTESVALADLIKLAHQHELPMIDDIGSGALADVASYGFREEPLPIESIRRGADVVLFSGDKLLGGPQCGIILGRRRFLEKLESHPLMRALRVDKLTLAALGGTLRLYRDPALAVRSIPALSMLATSMDNLKNRAERLAPQLADCAAIETAEAVSDSSCLGGGSVPDQEIPTWCVALTPSCGSVDRLAHRLRLGAPAVMGRIRDDRLLLDLRTVFVRQDQEIVAAVAALQSSTDEGEARAS